ncbi:MFS transporter [Paludisphaera borealis]|uniref:Putative sulfoacetate transporter SauU n=1 Tax=Paludisphaera borealis TaxID=1387353 RepID=A0A1U7CIZ6_9BACT|nr:MFS transporter [Paludisphaera borealis]APW58876.1 putative sulfoacetate transporter SauU [Paludisphaera borealis]
MSEAFDEEPTRVRYGVLGFLAAMTFVLYLDRACMGQAAPRIQEELGISNTRMGWVHSAFSLSYVLFEIPTGRWGDRYGSRGVLTRIVVWWSCFTAMTGFAGSLAMLLVIRFLFGAGEAGALPNSARVLRVWFSDANRGRAQGLITTAMMLGGTVAPIACQYLIDAVGWRYTFAAFGVIGLVWASAFYAWFRDDPAQHPAANEAERRLIVEGRGGGADPGLHAHGPIPWAKVFRSPDIWLLGGAMFTMAAIYNVLVNWYPKYLQAARGASEMQSGRLASLVLGAGAVGCLAGGWLTDWLTARTGNRRWGRTLQSVVGAALAASAITASLFVDSTNLSAVFVALACLGVQIQLPAWWAAATEVSGRHVGALFGMMNMIGNVGGILSASFLGWFVDVMKEYGREGRAQWDPGLAVYIGLALVGLVFWLLVDPRRTVESIDAPVAA